jgi:hypothetical protein
MSINIETVETLTKETQEINARIFREELEELSKDDLIDRLLEICQMNGLFGLIILVSLLDHTKTPHGEKPPIE